MMNKLVFNEFFHLYSIDGKNLPSVTTIIEAILETYKGLTGHQLELLIWAGIRGVAVHKALENNDIWEIGMASWKPYFYAGKLFLKLNPNIKIIHKELRLAYDLSFAGTVDMIVYDNKIKKYGVLDWKTTSQYHLKETAAQLYAYSLLIEKNLDIKIEFGRIIQLHKDGGYTIWEYDAKYGKEMWESIFLRYILKNG